MTDDDKKPVSYSYPSNSNKKKTEGGKNERKKLEKVITGKVVERKKPLGRKIAETFAGDDAQSVGSYILFEVIVPTVKSMISDAVSQGVERLLFGGGTQRNPSSRGSSGGRYTSYNKMYRSSERDRDSPRQISNKARASHNFTEVVLDSRGEAEMIIDNLIELINDYDVATVADLYDLVDIAGEFTDEKWGWTDLRGASVRRVREGYLLDLPRAVLLD